MYVQYVYVRVYACYANMYVMCVCMYVVYVCYVCYVGYACVYVRMYVLLCMQCMYV